MAPMDVNPISARGAGLYIALGIGAAILVLVVSCYAWPSLLSNPLSKGTANQ